jgi:DNA-binding CsgD family transcriptional regulator
VVKVDAQSRRRLATFLEVAETVDLKSASFWAGLQQPLSELLRGEGVIFGVTTISGLEQIRWMEAPGWLDRRGGTRHINAAFAQRGGFGLYQPRVVPVPQRNCPIVLTEVVRDTRAFQRSLGFDRFGLGGTDQIRMIISDGPAMRAWVGAYRADDDPFTALEKHLLSSTLRALRGRLELEAGFRRSAVASVALEVALEALGRPAFVADAKGRMQHGNALARQRDVRRELREPARWDQHPLRSPGLEGHALWVRRQGAPAGLPSWSMTSREREVLALVVRGLSNGSIAARLGCSERTVEVHVARLLEVSQCETRSQLVAEAWRAFAQEHGSA